MMNLQERIEWLTRVNDGKQHSVADTICRLLAEGKEVHFIPCDIVVYGETYQGFTVSAHDKRGDVWTSEPEAVLSDALSELWASIPEVD